MVEATSIIENLNDKSGSIFMDPMDKYYYAAFYIFGVVLFQVLFYFFEYVFNNVIVMHRYLDRDKQQKMVFSETIAANCFHLIMQPWSIYILLFPRCQDGDREPFAPLMDVLCFNTVDKRAVYMILWLGAYMVSDGYTGIFVIKGKT
jgi:hypothetical protein